ncbi:SET domain-containing protein [Epithele typhae]|uniref:SET domain-containing protein n=1 Tax=Epithele typhae TaxID=378194 RepID=UPI002007CF8A|nr:SET domain-containing protein [Epithele typhae]KAH9941878.1 SET domain-containing protein [Epithele typhae]
MSEEDEEEDGSNGTPTPSVSSTSTSELVPPPEGQSSTAPELSPIFKVAPAPYAGGFGLYATRPIRRGTPIFLERPALLQPPSTRSNSTIMAALARCTRDEQRHYFALANSFKHPRPGFPALLPAQGIFETNFLPCPRPRRRTASNKGEERDEELDGIFLQASRFNHSCRPNVAFAWDPHAGRATFRALRDVSAGEEMCINYAGVDVLGTLAERRSIALEDFGFRCACEVCALEGEAAVESDRRRAGIRRLFEDVAECGKEPTLGLRKIKIALRMLKEEHLVHYEASFCFDAFQFCVSVSDFANAKAWVRKAWEASCNTSGPDSPAARTFKTYWLNPRSHQLVGTLPRMKLSGPD